MKRISYNKRHIDYTEDNFGIRVYDSYVEAIGLADSGHWEPLPNTEHVRIPADSANFPFLNKPPQSGPISHIERSVAESDHREELMQLLHGGISFEDALVSRPT